MSSSSSDSALAEDAVSVNTLKEKKGKRDAPFVDANKNSLKNQADFNPAGKSATQKICDYLSFTRYKSAESDLSITGFGLLIIYFQSIVAGEFDFSIWQNYLIPLSFIACLLGLFGSIKSRRRKHQFLFICSALGLASFTVIGFSVGNLTDLLYGFWIILVLFLVNSLLSFILWKNYFIKEKP